jgi:hypothetical protein
LDDHRKTRLQTDEWSKPPAICQASRWTIKASKKKAPIKMTLKGKASTEDKIWEEGPNTSSSTHRVEINRIPATIRKIIRRVIVIII